MKIKVTVLADIDDEAFEEHDGDEMAPPNEIAEWDGTDVFRAWDLSLLIEPEMIELEVVE